MIWIAVVLAVGLLAGFALLRRGMRRGSTPAERAADLPGDAWLEGRRPARVVLTRAVSIDAPPDRVWPWIAQLGRGAGWYSYDALDNGGKTSARHVVSWIPAPRPGDATAIGYLRHLDPGRSLAGWLDEASFLGSSARSVTYFGVSPEGSGTRMVCRISVDAAGPTAHLALLAFRVIDSIMACRQLAGLRERAEHVDPDPARPGDPETGERDQYQFYETLFAAGGRAGVAGKEQGARFRQAAIRDGVIEEDPEAARERQAPDGTSRG